MKFSSLGSVYGRLAGLQQSTHNRSRVNQRSKSNQAMQLTGITVRFILSTAKTISLRSTVALSPGS